MEKMTVPKIVAKKGVEKIAMLTAYDYLMARLFDEVGVDMLLVGDSLGMVVQGSPNTLGVTMDEMIYHTRCVARAAASALVVGDMPFMSYQVDRKDAVRNAGRFIAEAGAEAVKLEGGLAVFDTIKAIVMAEIPVIGHVGLTPQAVHRMGGFKIQGRDKDSYRKIMSDAKAVETAGAFAIVLEGVPTDLAREITSMLSIPTIGIGAGAGTDGQVLVCYDMLGLKAGKKPKFVREFADLSATIGEATRSYVAEVRSGAFPGADHSFN